MHTSERIDFGTGKVSTVIIKQALPLTIAQLVQFLYSTVDRIYIGHISGVGVNALSGIGLTVPFVIFILGLSQLFGNGGTPIFSIARGSGDKERASLTLGNSFTMLLIASVVMTILFQILMHPLLYAFGASDNTYPFAASYLRIYLLGTAFTMLASGLNDYILAQGYPRTAMLSTLIGAVINVAIDPLFIFTFNLGIRGAAIATVISQAVSCAWVLCFLFGKKALYRINSKNIRLKLSICLKTMSVGLTGFVMQIGNCVVSIVANKSLNFYGGDLYVGIMTVVNSVCSVMRVAVDGITNGAKPVIGFNYGAAKFDRVKRSIVFSSVTALIYTGLAWAVVYFFPNFFFNIFSSEPELASVGTKYLHLYFLAYIFMALQFSGQSTFMALGMSKPAIFFSLLRKVFIVVPLTIILPMFTSDPIAGVFLAEPISNILGGTASFVTMYFTVYRKLGKNRKKEKHGLPTSAIS